DLGYWMRNGIDPIEAVKILDNRLITVQVHDLNNFSSEGHDVAWGKGAGNLHDFFSVIADMQLKPTLIGLEYSYNWGKSMPEIQESIEYFNHAVIRLAANKP
ncbi:MAG: hypothetical protein KAQ79_21555, partial [Cyclobacteriaceae bacterium]|nr:hypothetical protein [Cyclobacteriaceae bacterium]